ncbi:MAG: 4-hydroxythreonine-4-phosphate dehydrogenase PdxA [Hyphomicrobium sp.]|jgi:4-hydroxythreonine-4-phosphate dehydrogenase|nr:4-hydroxythreonine-4-phosphate dehydrogenase PdxA [Hyphomicrobium sp.]
MPAAPSDRPLPLAVTMGDPAGIGPEIVLKSYARRVERGLQPFVVYGCPRTLTERAHQLGQTVVLREVASPAEALGRFSSELPVLPIPVAREVRPGTPLPENAMGTISAIEQAVRAVVAGDASGIVTAPIAKAVLYAAGFVHPGHTEFLAALAGSLVPGKRHHPVMMLASSLLRVVPATIHVPLSDVPRALSRRLLYETIAITWRSLRSDFGIDEPRVAVAGLNPHAGEGGTIGREDIDLIAPAIEELRREGLTVTGPHSADTLFHAAARKTYDAAVCMYHDQALIPIKTLSFDTGVNVTLGLPFVRTSPDHGTAFDIAAQCVASPESMIAAIRMAAELSERRRAQAVAG